MNKILIKIKNLLKGLISSTSPYSSMRAIALIMTFTSCSVIVGTFVINSVLILNGTETLLEYNWLEASGFAATGITGKYWQKREEVKTEQTKKEEVNNSKTENNDR